MSSDLDLRLDETTLHLVRAALDSSLRWSDEYDGFITVAPDGQRTFSLTELLWFLSGEAEFEEDDRDALVSIVSNGPRWSEHDLIRALLDEVERLRNGTAE